MKNKETMNKKNIDILSMKVIDLKTLAKSLKISNFSKKRKSELIDLILKTKENNDKLKDVKKTNKKPKKNIERNSSKLLEILNENISNLKWFSKRNEIDKIIREIENIYSSVLESKIPENNDTDLKSKEKKEFYDLINIYKRKKREYYKELDISKNKNSEIKKDLIEKIKSLIGADDSINTIYKKFKDIQNKWHETGPALRKDNNNLWETYKHHVERFYDFLHINRELRKIDYKHNYNEKIKIIEKAEILCDYSDSIKAGKELNSLHLLWKNDLGPVAPEHREILWKRFQKASKIIHSKRQDFQKNIDEIQISNLNKKNSILREMENLLKNPPTNHYDWQKSIKNFLNLREDFKNIGSVNKNESKKNWNSFRNIGKEFNHQKNRFYKNQKINQKKKIENYKLLIDEVDQINKKDDWKKHLNRMKSIQNEFNSIGFVPLKISKNIRRDFIKKTNFYFKRLKGGIEHKNKVDKKIFQNKIDDINLLTLSDDTTKDLHEFFIRKWEKIIGKDDINEHSKNKIIEEFLKKVSSLTINREVNKNLLFEIESSCLKDNFNELKNRVNQYKKKQELVITEINQLENNLDFFTKSSNKSPILKDVTQKLVNLNDKSDKLKYKIDKLNYLIKNNSSKKDLNEKIV